MADTWKIERVYSPVLDLASAMGVGRRAGAAPALLQLHRHHFHGNDGVVHQQADGQHHAEHRQGVDGIAERGQHAERAQQHHRHGQRGDDGGAEVLQEQVHHQEDQDDGFHQRLEHFMDRQADERRRVVRIDDVHARREIRLQVVDGVAHRLRRANADRIPGRPAPRGRRRTSASRRRRARSSG
ncbi:hypothetical protein G6F40_014481 [Rhizopus arrhizus]|nr:hypothetical protein G6F40_014481 [Rhizopus arrhizus]